MPLSSLLLCGLAPSLCGGIDPAWIVAPATEAVSAIAVTATPRGQADSDTAPEIILTAEDMKAYGAGNIAQLVEALEPQLRSGRGRTDGPPVFLLNGRRVTGFQEISGIPTEAIEKTEVLSEETALKYGYRADQRVMNFILRKQFRARTAEVESRVATAGGKAVSQLNSNFFKITNNARWTLDVQVKHEDALFEAERDIVRTSDSSPFSLAGNILGSPRGSEIDPAFSALVGSTATAISLPTGLTGAPSLASLVAHAGPASMSDLTANRSLQPRSDQAVIKGAMTRDLDRNTSATLTASLDDTQSTSFLGLPGVSMTLPKGSPFSPFAKDVLLYRYIDAPESLTRDVETRKGQVNLAVNGRLADWRWTFTGSADRTDSETHTGRGLDTAAYRAAVAARDPSVNPFVDPPKASLTPVAPDTADSITTNANAELVLRGELYRLPAGDISTTLKSSLGVRALDAESVRSGVRVESDLSRKRAEAQGSFTVPIASRKREALTALGDLSVNVNAGYEDLSDFGALIMVGFGVNWSPIKPLSLVASFTDEDGAPSIQQLNDPVVFTPNVSVFDFATGSSVSITRIEGGNATLKSDKRRVTKLGANLKPFDKVDLTLNANYTRNEVDGAVSSFPTVTPDLEAAMPERFTRDAAGRLTSIDVRPVNFAGTEREELRWGLNYSKALGRLPQPAKGAPQPKGGQGARPQGGARPSQGLLQFSLYHTWYLANRITIRPGMAALDLLDGAAVGKRGGQPRHEVQLQAGYFKDGMGARLNGAWRARTWVDGGVNGQDLYFSDLATLNVQMFADLSNRKDLVKKYAWAKGARLSFNVDNLFDEKQAVKDAAGVTPQAYQPDYMDPVGRTVRLSVRKQFG